MGLAAAGQLKTKQKLGKQKAEIRMPTKNVTVRPKRRVARAALLFPRGEVGVRCGARSAERHCSKAALRQLAMQEPARVLEHLAD